MANNAKPLLSNWSYDVLLKAATVTLPGMGALYFTLSQIWHLPYGNEFVGTVAAINVFVGLLVRISSATYNKSGAKYDGTLEVVEENNKKTLTLSFDDAQDPVYLDQKKEVVFKVQNK